ncbi:hypothetical protein niasHT_016849 [Heterodera trifolii]|uniref:Uncharacterized protein n=1 Tax=Heterodera trifolii TaxID=157864 RepID=A0ABD2KT77_9BILA
MRLRIASTQQQKKVPTGVRTATRASSTTPTPISSGSAPSREFSRHDRQQQQQRPMFSASSVCYCNGERQMDNLEVHCSLCKRWFHPNSSMSLTFSIVETVLRMVAKRIFVDNRRLTTSSGGGGEQQQHRCAFALCEHDRFRSGPMHEAIMQLSNATVSAAGPKTRGASKRKRPPRWRSCTYSVSGGQLTVQQQMATQNESRRWEIGRLPRSPSLLLPAMNSQCNCSVPPAEYLLMCPFISK